MLRQIVVAALCGSAALSVVAQEVRTDDAYGEDFLHYKPYVVQGQKPKDKTAPAPKAPPAPAPVENQQKVNVKWLQENYKKLEEQAIDNPTDDNVAAYLYVKRITLDKSQRFSDKVTEVTNQDPLLNENNRVPYASTGAQSIRNANKLAQEQAVRELAAQGGLVIFVDGSCRFCVMQLPVIKALKDNYGVETLVVSLDGTRPKGYVGPIVRDNGLYRKLDLRLTPSIVYVHKPKGYVDGKDSNVYRIVAQGFYAQDELVKQIAFAGHSTNILSASTMRDLDVWKRGVASTEDLGTLSLDPKNTRAIRETLQPLLQKQY